MEERKSGRHVRSTSIAKQESLALIAPSFTLQRLLCLRLGWSLDVQLFFFSQHHPSVGWWQPSAGASFDIRP
jgi:hypothetical protein